MICCEPGLDLGWEWALTHKCSVGGRCSLPHTSWIQAVQLSHGTASSLTSFLFVPLGRTPPYLDPQSQEALYEVDVSGMPIDIYFNRIGAEKEGR
jgi:hypothetical protein